MAKILMKTPILSRRNFLKVAGVTATTGLTLGLGPVLSGCHAQLEKAPSGEGWRAWISIQQNNSVLIYCPKMEMGQGVLTSLAMLVAEELDADWSTVSVRHAPLDDRFGSQLTEDSNSVRSSWMNLRQLGAAARAQLIKAAAQKWSVETASCSTHKGYVIHSASERRASYGSLVELASQLDLSQEVTLKDPSQFSLIGRGVLRVDAGNIVAGSFQYTIDMSLPGMLTATVLHSPKLGARVVSVDDRNALAIAGVKATVILDSAVAVVAADFWSASQGLQQIKVAWTAPERPAMDERAMWDLLQEACMRSGEEALIRGGTMPPPEALPGAMIARHYSVPFDAHATMEPMSCVADVRAHSCEIWAPTQSPAATYEIGRDYGLSPMDRLGEKMLRKLTGTANHRVKVHAIPMGGSFGRRLEQDFVKQAVLISKAVKSPVKLIWNREQDIKNDFYRPASHHVIHAYFNEQARISAWKHRIAGSGILDHGADFPYDCEHVRVEASYHELGVPTGSLRSTGHSPNAFARECFMDELADHFGHDPVDYRLSLLSKNPRMKQTLQLAAERANWSARSTQTAMGVAIHPFKGSYIAQIAEVSVDEQRKIRIHRIICAVDCGLAINPDGIKAQIEGAITFGLSATLNNEITVHNGQIEQSNFHDFRVLRMSDMPELEIYLMPSAEPPGGIGEAGVPPVAPAVSNAVYAATGIRLRKLPLKLPSDEN